MSTPVSTGTVALSAEFAAVPGRGGEVEKLIAAFADVVRAEPGNLVFDVYRKVDAPDCFFVYEIYRDQAAFESHIAADEGAVFNAALNKLTVGDGSTLTFLRAVGGLI
ncbi:putative quinol monooxygenase [Leifsonia sp. YAF41]|uniref:putative quinol monooxygenase n=1 Tax=Leifsonia sp. YAF41 TaxID=3233086 RepID=UPI003F95B81E